MCYKNFGFDQKLEPNINTLKNVWPICIVKICDFFKSKIRMQDRLINDGCFEAAVLMTLMLVCFSTIQVVKSATVDSP